ncbi:DNA polymerase III subunit delta' [Phosphitispora sp. TUW77]|uniref:DNA polymerase III subunit delta' n=1 Tax=Phosphitispora sp. TUW77 TaxID=3152361 RepID=UPI003AB1A0B8
MMMANVIGHKQAKIILQNAAAEGRVAHAYLFYGLEGVGKTTLAKAFANTLLCKEGNIDTCDECSICRRFAKGCLPDFFLVEPHGNNIKIEQIRELQQTVSFKPYEASKKVYLISRAETMTRDAANCLLKILEDPPPDTIFLLTTVNPYNLLPTIVSRCQIVALGKVPQQEIEQFLRDNNRGAPETVVLLATLCNGLPGKAWAMAEPDKGLETREMVFQLYEKIKNGDISELIKKAEELEKNKDIMPEVLEQLLLWYRDQLIWQETSDKSLIINIDKIEELKSDLEYKDKSFLVKSIENIHEAKMQINRNLNFRLTMEVLMLKLAKCT